MFRIAETVRTILGHIRPFRRQPDIADTATYNEFLAGRSSYVAQKKLFEYVKQRMGISYPKHFEDDEFIASLQMAQWRVYAACLSDLALWMAAQLMHFGAGPAEAQAIAVASHRDVMHERFDEAKIDGGIEALQRDFEARAALADWAKLAQSDFDAFQRSSDELVRWAPIADQLKRYDREIVSNSLRYAWLDVRVRYKDHLKGGEALADWRRALAS